MLGLLNSERSATRSPPRRTRFFDKGRYIYSSRTIYRILADAGEVNKPERETESEVVLAKWCYSNFFTQVSQNR